MEPKMELKEAEKILFEFVNKQDTGMDLLHPVYYTYPACQKQTGFQVSWGNEIEILYPNPQELADEYPEDADMKRCLEFLRISERIYSSLFKGEVFPAIVVEDRVVFLRQPGQFLVAPRIDE
jgi:hypothetical protein